ncbi:MAG: hypothetical protein PHF84_01965 [bacterium]|nr:hypothetical protein [bacterium]
MHKIKFLLQAVPLLLIIFIITVNHGLKYFIDPLALLYVLIFSLSLFSYSEGKAGLRALYRIIFKGNNRKAIKKDILIKMLNNLISYIYIAGVTGLIVGQIMLLNLYPLSKFSTQRHIADSLLALLYSIIINELLIRPIKNSIKN